MAVKCASRPFPMLAVGGVAAVFSFGGTPPFDPAQAFRKDAGSMWEELVERLGNGGGEGAMNFYEDLEVGSRREIGFGVAPGHCAIERARGGPLCLMGRMYT